MTNTLNAASRRDVLAGAVGLGVAASVSGALAAEPQR
jgi:hypothetical protein